MSTQMCQFLHSSAVHACYCPQCIAPWFPLSRLDTTHFFAMKRPATSALAPSSTRKDTSLLSKALRELSGACNLKQEWLGHYLAKWALSCPPTRLQFNNTAQYVNSATSNHTTGEACKASVEAYAASLLPPTATCELVLNMRAPKSCWRTLSELYTLRKLEYHRTGPSGLYSRSICTERAFQARWKELVAPVQWDDPVATVLPKATRISWPFASWVTYILSRPGLVRSIHRNFPLTFIVRGDAYPVAGGKWTQLTISLANFDRFARSPAGLWVLSMANCDDKAMDTLRRCGRAIGRYSSHLVPFARSSFDLVGLEHRSLDARLD